MRKLYSFLILFIALGAGLYTQRVAVLDWYRDITSPTLPDAVSYEDMEQMNESQEDDQIIAQEETEEDQSVVSIAQGLDESVEAESEVQEEMSTDQPVEEGVQEESILPSSINLAVPFTPQAPHGNWDPPYKELCEEASVYMVDVFFRGEPEGRIPEDEADADLLRIVAFEEEIFGYYEDTTAEQTGILGELMFGYTYTLIENPQVKDIKEQLAQGRPVIVPAAGRLLGNPYFTAPGPLYHMIVIRGYTEDGQFIVNDPGTSRGEGYLYDFDTIMNAMHDWNNGEDMTQGKRVALVFNP